MKKLFTGFCIVAAMVVCASLAGALLPVPPGVVPTKTIRGPIETREVTCTTSTQTHLNSGLNVIAIQLDVDETEVVWLGGAAVTAADGYAIGGTAAVTPAGLSMDAYAKFYCISGGAGDVDIRVLGGH